MKKHNLLKHSAGILPGINIGYPILFFMVWMSSPARDLAHLIVFYILLLAWLPLIGFSIYVFRKSNEKKIFFLGTIIWNGIFAFLLCLLLAFFFIHFYHATKLVV